MYKQQRINCIEMMLRVLSCPPPRFDMKHYVVYNENGGDPMIAEDMCTINPWDVQEHKDDHKDKVHACSTSCCFLGTGAFFNIGNPDDHADWESYAGKTYGVPAAHSFLFSPKWVNEPAQAAARMQYYLRLTPEEQQDEPYNHDWDELYHNDESIWKGDERWNELTAEDIKGWKAEQAMLADKD